MDKTSFNSAKQAALRKYFSRMNEMQQEAVFTVNGPLLVLAGAGSGKTTVIVNRIANLINFGNAYYDETRTASDYDIDFLREYADGKTDDFETLRDIVAVDPVKPWNILAITFTNKAAGELRERLTAMLGEEALNINASTFHSACVRILRSEIEAMGYGRDFTIYDSDDSQRMIKSVMAEIDISEKQFAPRMVLSEISAAKDKMITPEQMREDAGQDYRKKVISRLYALYQQRMMTANALDFDDILTVTTELFEKFPEGYDGGTGAAPSSSIYNAGLPWELGLAEAHQTLKLNGLRSRVRIETDGKLMTGRDVLVAALLGAEEFGFATAPLVTMGCVMMRVCNLDTCPMGIATQNPELRKRFRGKPEHIVNFMHFIAQELREYMAKLGIRTVDELIGRTDLLYKKECPEAEKMDFSQILTPSEAGGKQCFDPADVYDFELEKTVDKTVIMKKLSSALKNKTKKTIDINVVNTDRALGTLFGSEITRRWGENALDDDTFTVRCTGSGGQSFGAFIPKGLTLELTGDSNDYFGKGLSGGKLILYPPRNSGFKAEENIIVGNVALYGATSGKAFINGIAGERFCVRNSGAVAVCEGVGDHGCEYMTGGRAVILGKTGKNFAAGMSGGIAYVLDEDRDLYMKLNKSLVSLESVTEKYDILELKGIIEEHAAATGSEKAKKILADFDRYVTCFKKIIPHDYAKIRSTVLSLEEKGMTSEQAEIEAFFINKKEA